MDISLYIELKSEKKKNLSCVLAPDTQGLNYVCLLQD